MSSDFLSSLLFSFLLLIFPLQRSFAFAQDDAESIEYQNGYQEGYQDAIEGVQSRCQSRHDCPSREDYARGYKLGYKKGIRELKKQGIRPVDDSPGRTIGSDFDGDGIHDFMVAAHGNNSNTGAVYIFFGSSNLSALYDIGGGVNSPDVTILGKSGNRLGWMLASAGDVNGDGLDDIIVGAYLNDDGTGNNGGATYIFFGSTTLSGTKDLAGTASADVTFLGKADSDYSGYGVSGAGDVNGDGFDDIIVGAKFNDDGASPRAGAAYIFFGASDLSGTKDLGAVDSADVTLLGKAANDRLGNSVSGAGDVNGDGFDDVIVAAIFNADNGSEAGAAYILFGASDLSGTKDIASADEDVIILAKAGGDRLGGSVAGVGDLNGDGFDDVIVGAHLNNDGGSNNEGAAYVFFGGSNLSGIFDLSGGAQSPNVTILGKGTTDRLGFGLGLAGDINDDGFDDFAVGAPYNNDGGSNNEGTAYIIFGSRSLSGLFDMGDGVQSPDVTIFGKATTDSLGSGISGVGDVNDDGIPDFMVGARNNNDGGGDDYGAAYVFFGATDLSGTKDTGSADEDVRILGTGANSFLGRTVGGGRNNPGP